MKKIHEPIGVRCYLAPMSGGAVAVLPRARSGGGSEQGAFFSRSKFLLVEGRNSTVAYGPREEEEAVKAAPVDTRTPWQPTAFATSAPDITPGTGDLPANWDCHMNWSVENAPDWNVFKPIWGLNADYTLEVIFHGVTNMTLFSDTVHPGDGDTVTFVAYLNWNTTYPTTWTLRAPDSTIIDSGTENLVIGPEP